MLRLATDFEKDEPSTAKDAQGRYRLSSYIRVAYSPNARIAAEAREKYAFDFPYDERSGYFAPGVEQAKNQPSADWYTGVTLAGVPLTRLMDDLQASQSSKGSNSSMLNFMRYSAKWQSYEIIGMRTYVSAEGLPDAVACHVDSINNESIVNAITRQFQHHIRLKIYNFIELRRFNDARDNLTPEEASVKSPVTQAPLTSKLRASQAMLMNNDEISIRERLLIHVVDPLYSWNNAVHGGMEAGQGRETEAFVQAKLRVDEWVAERTSHLPQQPISDSGERQQLESAVRWNLLTAVRALGWYIEKKLLINYPAGVAAAAQATGSALDGRAPFLYIGKDVTRSDARG